MKVGLSIARFNWPGQPDSFGPRLTEIATRADESGVHSLWAMDHFWQIGFNGPPEEPLLESYTLLPYLAGITRHVHLGALVTGVSYRHPAGCPAGPGSPGTCPPARSAPGSATGPPASCSRRSAASTCCPAAAPGSA